MLMDSLHSQFSHLCFNVEPLFLLDDKILLVLCGENLYLKNLEFFAQVSKKLFNHFLVYLHIFLWLMHVMFYIGFDV